MKALRLLAIIVSLVVIPQLIAGESDAAAVKKQFEASAALSEKFDPSVADLYSDDAVVKTDRHYPNGTVKNMQMEGKAWKAALRAAMPLAKERGDISTYADVKVEAAEGGKVRVSAQRTSKLKGYTSPMSRLYSKSPDGKWLIIEEHLVTKP